MPLRKTRRFRDWIARDQPSERARLVTAEFLLQLAEQSYAAPSAHVEQLSNQPVDEVREVYLPVARESAVWILFRHTYGASDDAGLVDVIDIARGGPAP